VRAGLHRHASLVHAPTLWQRVREAGLVVAALDWPATLGADVQFLLPDVAPERPGELWGQLVAASATPAIAALASEGGGLLAEPGAVRDAFLVETACRLLYQPNAPRLILLRLRQTEQPLTRFGPGTPEVEEAFAEVDAAIAVLDRCLAELRLSSPPLGTALVVTGDRVMRPVHTAIHPNVLLAEAGLQAIDEEGRSVEWQALSRSNGGSAFVYARDAQSALEARRALSALAESSGAFRLIPAEEMIEQQADREAWFGLAASPGFLFNDSLGGRLLAPAARRGAAGYFGGEAGEPTPGWVAIGTGLRRGLRVPLLTQRDVAPTLAALLEVELSSATGRELVGLLWTGAPLATGGLANPNATSGVSGGAGSSILGLPPAGVAAPPIRQPTATAPVPPVVD
jgi:hypothetical protein